MSSADIPQGHEPSFPVVRALSLRELREKMHHAEQGGSLPDASAYMFLKTDILPTLAPQEEIQRLYKAAYERTLDRASVERN